MSRDRIFPILDRPTLIGEKDNIDERKYWECVERYKEEMVAEEMDEYDVTREEAIGRLEDENWLWDYEGILEDMKSENYEFYKAKEEKKVRRALNKIKQDFPDIYPYLEGSVFIFWGDYERLGSRCVMVPQATSTECNYAIFMEKGTVDNGTVMQIASVLIHEGMHLDLRVHPTKYGLSEEWWDRYLEELLGTVEDRIDKKIKEESYPRGEIEGWNRDIHFRTINPVYSKLYACMEGKSCPAGYRVVE